MIRETMNPHSRASRMPMERPWMRVPRQKLLTSAMGLSLNSYNVESSAAPITVAASSSIQNLRVRRALRGWRPVDPFAQSGEGTEAETRCQNSDVPIIFRQPHSTIAESYLVFRAERHYVSRRATELNFQAQCVRTESCE